MTKLHCQKNIGALILASCVVISLYILTIFIVAVPPTYAQVPKPYIKCNQTNESTGEKEWHSLRPYQASPCKIPFDPNEQALICGNDLIINDKIYVPPDPHDILRQTCTPPWGSCCNCTITCTFKAPRKFFISFDAYESELPVSGNTELVKEDDDLSLPQAKWRLTDFEKKPPPEIETYDEFIDYYKDYEKWRGKTCSEITLPIINKRVLLCWDSPLQANFWAILYPKIPYSSTEDRLGKARVDDMIWFPNKSSVERIEPNPPNTDWYPHDPAYGADPNIKGAGNGYGETALYFPHMEENLELTSLLQSTYVPKELLEKQQANSDVEASPKPDQDCKIVNVRYNPGDQLFGEKENGYGVPQADVSYTAYFKCEVVWSPPDPITGECHPSYYCERNAWFQSDVSIYTPLIDELFTKTVAGNAAVFKKIYPQVGQNTPLNIIEDIPVSSEVGHIGIDKVTPSTPVEVVSDPAEFYIPHFGSIYDYLLHDMQTALRPKGYPGKPAALSKSQTIDEQSRMNEYLSWYLNGTVYHAERNALDIRVNNIDAKRIPNNGGVINKLLSQNSQWYNYFSSFNKKIATASAQPQGRVDSTKKAQKTRHDQVAACTLGMNLPAFIKNILGHLVLVGIPIPCDSASQDNLPASPTGPGGPNNPSGTCPQVADSEIPANYLSMKPGFVDWANRLLAGCEGPDNNLADECYNYVVKESLTKNVNAGFSLAIWLHESGASNYCYVPSGVEDMGIHVGSQVNNLVDQLEKFLLLPFGSAAKDCAYNTSQGWPTPMHGFLCTYASGGCSYSDAKCDPNVDTAYYNLLSPYFTGITGCGSMPTYPTDKTCPN